MHLPQEISHSNETSVQDLNAGVERISDQFAESIDNLYRAAISADPSPRSQIAFACHLADHGDYLESLGEFEKMLDFDSVKAGPAYLTEIIYHVARIENRLEDDDLIGRSELSSIETWRDWNESEISTWEEPTTSRHAAREVGDLINQLMGPESDSERMDVRPLVDHMDQQMLTEVGHLLNILWTDRTVCERRRTGLTLLKLGLFCGRHNWCEIDVACIRKAIRCFQQAAVDVRNSRQRSAHRSMPGSRS
jgi:hypothetical protein